jgi:hypothetical protein
MSALGIGHHYDLIGAVLVLYIAALAGVAISLWLAATWVVVALGASWALLLTYALHHMLFDHPRSGLGHHLGEPVGPAMPSPPMLAVPIVRLVRPRFGRRRS